MTDLKIKFCSYDEISKTLLENGRLVRDERRVAKSSDKFENTKKETLLLTTEYFTVVFKGYQIVYNVNTPDTSTAWALN